MKPIQEAMIGALPTTRYEDRRAVVAAMEAFFREAGATHWFVAVVPLPAGDLANGVICTNWPEEWLAHYLRDHLWHVDPMFTVAIGARSAIRPDEALTLVPRKGRAGEIIEAYSAHGLHPLLAIPCLSISKFQAIAIVSGLSLPDDEASFFVAAARRFLHRLYDVAPEALSRNGQLTARERQIVSLSALGKTSNEIAAELGISPRTVFAHLNSAGHKLSAANKTETVVNAFRYGQIAL